MQSLAVALIVVVAVVFTVWRLMPRAWRVALASSLAAGAQRHVNLSQDNADALARSLAKGACGGCDDCGSCGPKTPAVAQGKTVVEVVPRK